MTRLSTGSCGGKWARGGFALALGAVLVAFAPLRSLRAAGGSNTPLPGTPTLKPEEKQPGDNESPPPWHYDTLDVNSELKSNHKEIKRILAAGDFQGNDLQTFDEFYTQYYLARWTLEENLGNLAWCQARAAAKAGGAAGGGGGANAAPPHANYRFDLRSHFHATSGAVYRHLNDLVLDFMNKLVAGNYHPAVRFNAMLAIGELTQEPEGHTSPPPLTDALRVLVAGVNNRDLPDCVRVAAMIGILRHVEAGIDDDDARKSVAGVMLNVSAGELKLKNQRVQDWLLGQALTGLGLLGSVGDNQAAFQALVKAIGDPKCTLSVRSIATEALAQLDYSDAGGINVDNAAAMLARFAVAACDEETGAGQVDRGRMKQRLDAVFRAINGSGGTRKGIRSLAKEDERLANLQKLIHQASDDLDNPDKSMDAKGTVDSLHADLDTWLKGKAE